MITRYRVPADESAEFAVLARTALATLTARPGCRAGRVGRAIDDPGLWSLVTDWESVGAYRRALSDTAVKLHAVPLMYRCVDEPTAFEDQLSWAPGTGVVEHASAIAEDPFP